MKNLFLEIKKKLRTEIFIIEWRREEKGREEKDIRQDRSIDDIIILPACHNWTTDGMDRDRAAAADAADDALNDSDQTELMKRQRKMKSKKFL